jgi:hypothetical protein
MASKTIDDKNTITTFLTQIFIVRSEFKPIHLGKIISATPRPIKLIFENHNVADQVLLAFHSAKSNPTIILPPISIVRDKTPHERELLRACHQEFDRQSQAGESGLIISYRNDVPCVLKSRSKNFNRTNITRKQIKPFLFRQLHRLLQELAWPPY